MKRHNHHIVSKRGQKYEVDQQKWTMSSNFPWNHSIVEAGMNIFVEPVDQSKSWDYFVRWHASGSITSTMLVNMLKTLDVLNCS